MEGSYLAHSLYGYFAERRLALLGRSGRQGDGRARSAQAALPAAADDERRDVPRARAARRDGDVSVELTEEHHHAAGEKADATYKLVVTAGSEHEEYDGPDAQEGPQQHRRRR